MNSLGTQRLETSRLILRRATSDDAPAMYKNWVCDPEVTKYLTWSPYKSLDEAHDYIREQIERWEHDDSFYDWFIELKSIGEVIGTIGFVRSNLDIASFDMGMPLAVPGGGRASLRRPWRKSRDSPSKRSAQTGWWASTM